MDILYHKANTLLDIWVELGFADAELAELSGVQARPRGNSEWARKRMQCVLDELDRLIEYERQEKQRLAAEIEDLLFSIDDTCSQLGQRIENVTPLAAVPETIERSHSMKRYLRQLNNELLEELNRRRTNVQTWLTAIKLYAAEIYEVHEMPPFEAFENDLTGATVQSVFVKYDALHKIVTSRRHIFENTAAKIRFYWHALHHETSDSIDEALAHLFSQCTSDVPSTIPIDEPITTPQYYQPPLPSLLSLTPSCLELLKEKLAALEEDYRDRLAKKDRYQKGISLLWGELEIPVEERTMSMIDSFDLAYLEQLATEYDRLKQFMRERIDKYVDQFRDKLTALWDKCLLSQRERDEFVEMLHDKADTMEQARIMIQEHLDYLSTLQTVGEKVFNLMRERRDLIQKMIDFEKTASDPRRLFQSSFQLLQEEKWRKACYPNLLKLEDALVRTVIAYENNSKRPFMYQGQRYLDSLHLEITDRNVNQTFFGFLDDGPKRPPRKSLFEAPPGATPGAASAVTHATAGTKAAAHPKPQRNNSTKSIKSVSGPGPNGASVSSRPHSPGTPNARGTRTPAVRSQLLTHANLNTNGAPHPPHPSTSRRPRTSSFSSSNSTSIASTPSPSTSTQQLPASRRPSKVPAVANTMAAARARKISLPASMPATRPASPVLNKKPSLPNSTTPTISTRPTRATSVGAVTALKPPPAITTTRKTVISPLASPPHSGSTDSSESTETVESPKDQRSAPPSRISLVTPTKRIPSKIPQANANANGQANNTNGQANNTNGQANNTNGQANNTNGQAKPNSRTNGQDNTISVPSNSMTAPPSPTKKFSLQDLLDPSVPSVAVLGPAPPPPSLKGPRGRRMSVQIRKTSVVKEVVKEFKESSDKVVGVEHVVKAVEGAIKGVDNVTRQAELVSTGVAAAAAAAAGVPHKRRTRVPTTPMLKT